MDIRFCGCGWEWMPVRGFLCLFWLEIHTKGLRTRFPTRPEEDNEGPRAEQKKAVNRRRQSARVSSRQKSGKANGQRKATAWTCASIGWVGQHERMNQHSWWLCRNFAGIHACNSQQMHRKLHKSVTNFTLHMLRANPSPCLFVLFSSTLSVVYAVFCLSVKKCEIPLYEDERNH